MFDGKMRVDVHRVRLLTYIGVTCFFLKNDKFLRRKRCPFLLPCRRMQYIQKRDNESGPTPVHRIFTNSFNLLIPNECHFSCQFKCAI